MKKRIKKVLMILVSILKWEKKIPIVSINNSSLKFEIMAKQLYVASQRVL